MALRVKVLRKKAEKFEKKGMDGYRIVPERVSVLERLLNNVYVVRRPQPNDYVVRKDLVRIFNQIAKEIYGNSKDAPVVEEFGSFAMDLFSTKSDLDMSINFVKSRGQISRAVKIQTLRKFAKKLYALQRQGHVSGVHPVTTAKVPIVKVVDLGTGIECDLSVENRDGILKSQIIHIISAIDERFPKLCFLMKAWAKAQNINSSKDGTLNSLSIILLVAFHLQTRDPPILPPFSSIFTDGIDAAAVAKSLPKFVNYGRNNKESLAGLFITLLIKLSSVEKLWPKGICASTYEASWLSKTWESKIGCFSVEDFSDRSQNVARAVAPAEFKRIYRSINLSLQHVSAFMDGLLEESKLRDFLFGGDAMTLADGTARNIKKRPAHIPALYFQNERLQSGNKRQVKEQACYHDPPSNKRVALAGGLDERPSRSWGQTEPVVPSNRMYGNERWSGPPNASQEMPNGMWQRMPVESWDRRQQAMPQQPSAWGVTSAGNSRGSTQPNAGGWRPESWGKMLAAGGWSGVQGGGWAGNKQDTGGMSGTQGMPPMRPQQPPHDFGGMYNGRILENVNPYYNPNLSYKH